MQIDDTSILNLLRQPDSLEQGFRLLMKRYGDSVYWHIRRIVVGHDDAVSAQQKNDEDFGKRLYEARLAEVALKLELSDKQKTAFAPIYEQYCKEMSQLIGMEKQKKAQEIRLSYADKFATVLSDKQLVAFFEVENQIQGKMRDRAKNVRGKKK